MVTLAWLLAGPYVPRPTVVIPRKRFDRCCASERGNLICELGHYLLPFLRSSAIVSLHDPDKTPPGTPAPGGETGRRCGRWDDSHGYAAGAVTAQVPEPNLPSSTSLNLRIVPVVPTVPDPSSSGLNILTSLKVL